METTRDGSSLHGVCDASEKIGLRTLAAKIGYEKLHDTVPLPCIVLWKQSHFIVVYMVTKSTVYVSDPAIGLIKYSRKEFVEGWLGLNAPQNSEEGVVVLFEPTNTFRSSEDDEKESKNGFVFLLKYFSLYRRFIVQLFIGLLVSGLLQFLFPFLTQSIVDIGIVNQDIHFIYIILFAQIFLFLGKTSIEIIRAWILLHLSARINISLISDFFIKLMRLPISFFDVKLRGDLIQRIDDHYRVESLLTSNSMNVLFSFFSLVIFGGVLAWYSISIFVIFFIGTVLYIVWVVIFMNTRKKLDYKKFSQTSQEKDKVMELIDGMQEIKLQNAERKMRWSWEYLQARLFKVSMKTLALEQTQLVGSSFINELKNIFITFYAARLVIQGDLTLGMMLSISYIIGQLNGPISQLVNFLHSAQDAKISLERLNEIHNKEEEESASSNPIIDVPINEGFKISNVSFRYKGTQHKVLNNLNLIIPPNKVTAIVGASGSGKTTLMKLLLKFYDSDEGTIHIGQHDLRNVSSKVWRSNFGVVMQEGYIFSDSIANNIAVGPEHIDKKQLLHAIEVSNIGDYIDGLPLGVNTKIGREGMGMSTGQKQRLLIARAIYKNPKYLFFDEATSALDASNERTIMDNLNEYFQNRTVVVIAHRLSTVKNADQIVVLTDGSISEIGTHNELIDSRGMYYNLVRNQLELEKLNDDSIRNVNEK